MQLIFFNKYSSKSLNARGYSMMIREYIFITLSLRSSTLCNGASILLDSARLKIGVENLKNDYLYLLQLKYIS